MTAPNAPTAADTTLKERPENGETEEAVEAVGPNFHTALLQAEAAFNILKVQAGSREASEEERKAFQLKLIALEQAITRRVRESKGTETVRNVLEILSDTIFHALVVDPRWGNGRPLMAGTLEREAPPVYEKLFPRVVS